VPHRSGIVEVSIAHYYVKESDLWQGDFNIIIIIIVVVHTLGMDFHCTLFVPWTNQIRFIQDNKLHPYFVYLNDAQVLLL